MEHNTQHLDSRRSEGEPRAWGDYVVRLDDQEAIESSPFQFALEALREFGFNEVMIYHPTKEDESSDIFEDDISKWIVSANKKFTGTEPMIADVLGGEIQIDVEIDPDGERVLSVCFGAGDYNRSFKTKDLNEAIWAYLEVIHKILSDSWAGRDLPIASHGRDN